MNLENRERSQQQQLQVLFKAGSPLVITQEEFDQRELRAKRTGQDFFGHLKVSQQREESLFTTWERLRQQAERETGEELNLLSLSTMVAWEEENLKRPGPFSSLSALAKQDAASAELVSYPRGTRSGFSLLRVGFRMSDREKMVIVTETGQLIKVVGDKHSSLGEPVSSTIENPPPPENLTAITSNIWEAIAALRAEGYGKRQFSAAMREIINRETAGLSPEEQRAVRQEIGGQLMSLMTAT